ncbi:UDP-N-acetylglucosamine--N-acetylmuramyl-(pentapeptide) pyrophosphoryl-undecaprenol N-acetylglucosamine transferase [Halobacteriovorax sp. HLS]|uniref:UDP-N-acetylglucosamine--N-acetylmuramyl- (pentapeptide) pyrophosphoryl-undecaprenol N-acetylglucosamine transferase n=1 Tax=Halobacteriovorax sp. HLS TaxID=2234000 RepID=UPI0013E31E69|nr:UDP-N-acetylglucosamine--N-acetylmuramyl-(pentapeptide) pyrophosphoryl-undecaprenol N-acetylglucosamine transferase [Halobacteriovorax sp. HLS]
MRKIVFTGGGSGGHVMPAITLIKKLKESGNWDISYIGGKNGIERSLISEFDIPYKAIFTGKLRRYFSFENFLDLFKVGLGFLQSFFSFISMPSNTLVFATGGFVCVPVVIAAKLTGKKVFIHEQTSRVGLANKICSKFADTIFVSFEESIEFFPRYRTKVSGYPLRDECYNTHIETKEIQGFPLISDKPLLFVTGGGNGSLLLNNLIKSDLEELNSRFRIIHQVGKNFIEEFLPFKSEDYLPVAFVGSEMIDIMKSSEIVISRSGAGTVCELLALKKRSIYIPLKIAQKNEQFHNAMEAHRKLGSLVISEDELPNMSIIEILDLFDKDKSEHCDYTIQNGTEFILDDINCAL